MDRTTVSRSPVPSELNIEPIMIHEGPEQRDMWTKLLYTDTSTITGPRVSTCSIELIDYWNRNMPEGPELDVVYAGIQQRTRPRRRRILQRMNFVTRPFWCS